MPAKQKQEQDYFKFMANEDSVAADIPYSSHVTKSIIKLTNGDYIQVLKLEGAAHESADNIDINSWHDQLNGFLRNIASPHIALWSHIVRRSYNKYPEGEFDNEFCKQLDDKYREHMLQDTMLINELYITIVYRPQPNKITKVFDIFGKAQTESEAEKKQLDEIQALQDATNIALSALDRYDPEVLSCYEHKGNMFSETLEFLAYLINGFWERFPLPRKRINHVMAVSRPFFGKGGLMAIKTPTKTYYSSILSILDYPSITSPVILNELLSMPFEFTFAQSFTFLSKAVAVGRMTRQQARMVNAGDVAVSQIEQIDDALDDLTSNRFVLGAYNNSLIIRSQDNDTLNLNITDARTAMADVGIRTGVETSGLAGAFWSQLPANFAYRVSVEDITSRNFAAFCNLHNFPIGRISGNQWGDAVTMFRTSSGAPYYFNYHKGETGEDAKKISKLDPNHKDLANTVVIGKSGSGKTVLELFLLAQTQKFNNTQGGKKLSCVVFDKDLGASVGVRAMGGRYYPLKNGVSSGFNPFQCEPTPNNLTFLESLVKQLVHHQGLPLSPRQTREISEAIKGVMGVADKSKRRLSAVLEFLDPTDENGLHPRLARWCRGGALHWLFDNAEDTLIMDDCTMVGFDVTDFLDNPETRTPTIMYLFHRIESLFDGRRVPIFMDEFWKLLDDPAFEDLAKNKLVTIRKQDGFLVMFTQSPKQVLESPIAFAIISQTATKIFLPNPEADYEDYVEGFKLTEREYEIVRGLGEKSRQFLIKQGHNSVVAELNLRGFDNELAVLSGNTATSLLAEKLVAEFGNDPAKWLPEFHKQRKGI